MQTLWQSNVDWDEKLPDDIIASWNDYQDNLLQINSISVRRQVTSTNPIQIELHGFSDASDKAYGACLYIRCIDKSKNICCFLLCSKSRVAPLKRLTTPRLELFGALLLARLTDRVKQFINLNFDQIYYWTDSTIVLAWIQSESRKFKTFVGNRVSEIQEISHMHNWYHVKTNDNPADLISRGTDIHILNTSNLWWHGPTWLKSSSLESILTKNHNNLNINMPELKVTTCISSIISEPFPFEKFSKYERLIRVATYCIRFSNNCKLKNKTERNIKNLTPHELKTATLRLISGIQNVHFKNQVNNLKRGKLIPSNSKLMRLNPKIT